MSNILSNEMLKFIEKYDELHPNQSSARYHNLYELKTTDRDGNVVDTKFGINLMTDYGFSKAYKYDTYNYYDDNYRIWIGDGTDYPKYDNTTIFNSITSSNPGNVVAYYDTDHCEGQRYNKTDGLCYMTRKACSCYYDYNIKDMDGNTIETDVYIREIGIGSSKSTLCTHAKIYNEQGEEASIVKRPNQRLHITAYITTSMDPKIIQDNYDKGIFGAIDMRLFTKHIAAKTVLSGTMFWYLETRSHHTRYVLSNDANYNTEPFYGTYKYYGDQNVLNDETHEISATYGDGSAGGSGGGGLIEDKYMYLSERSFLTSNKVSRYNTNKSYINYTTSTLDTFIYNEGPEEIEQIVYTNGRETGSFSSTFGRGYTGISVNGRIPALDFDLQSLKMYNHETKEWDIDETFINNTLLNLYNIWIGRYVAIKIYIPFLDSHRMAYIFTNPFTDRPITSFNNSGITLYATDTYWDVDSWETIPNLSQVSDNLQTKRYYISLTNPETWPTKDTSTDQYGYYSNGLGLFPKRSNDIHHEVLTKSGAEFKKYTLPYQTYEDMQSGRTASSDQYGYVVCPGCVFYPDDINEETGLPYVHKLYGDNGVEMTPLLTFNFDREDKVLTFGGLYNKPNTKYTYPDGQSGYVQTPRGGYNLGFRVYDMTNEDHTQPPAYQDYEFDLKYFSTNSSWHDMPYYIPYATKSASGFIVLTGSVKEHSERLPFSRVINLYGGEDGNTVDYYDLTENCYSAIAVDRNEYICVYTNKQTGVYEVRNVNTREVYRTFSLEGHTLQGFVGWKNYIYLYTLKDSIYYSWVYHIEENMLEYLPNEDFTILEFACKSYSNNNPCRMSTDSTDDVFVIATSADDPYNEDRAQRYASVYFTSDNPTHLEFVLKNHGFSTINNTNASGRVYKGSLQVKYLNGEKRQLVYAAGGNRRHVIVDLGMRIDDDPNNDINYFPYYNFPWYNEDYGPATAIYKDRIISMHCHENGGTTIREYPIDYCLPHKMKGTTRTITSYNNPVRISNIKSASISVTNRVDPNGIPDETDTTGQAEEP